MITKSKLRKLANSHSRKKERKDIIYAYKLMCKEIKSRAKDGHFYYGFKHIGYGEVLPITFRFFRLKHRDLACRVTRDEEITCYEVRW